MTGDDMVRREDVLALLQEWWDTEGDHRTPAEVLAALPAAQVAAKPLAWNRTDAGLPQKPGKWAYEQIECLIRMPNGDIEVAMWNCEHLVWDDAYGDDYRHDALDPTHWIELARIDALELTPALEPAPAPDVALLVKAARNLCEQFALENPMRTGDWHGEMCQCLRCRMDQLQVALAKLESSNG
jgi:hypothetical protein